MKALLFKIIIISNILLFSFDIQADTKEEWTDLLEQLMDNSADEGEEQTNLYTELSELTQNPINLNEATKESFKPLFFLTEEQVEEILYYVYLTGGMKTVYELQLIEKLDQQTIRYLLPFVHVAEVSKKINVPSWRQISKYGKSTILLRTDIPLNTKKGYLKNETEPADGNKHYIGSNYYHSIKYGYQYKDQLYWGLVAEKDPGEAFFKTPNRKGFDSYSYYLLIKNIGKLKSLVLGNYRLSFGQGLVLSSDYMMGKTTALTTFGYKQEGIKKHSSTDEYNYFSGIASTIQLKQFLITAFYSHRNLDATVENDTITSINKTGIHRIEREIDRSNCASIQLMGGNMQWNGTNTQLGITGTYYAFNVPYQPAIQPYSYFNLAGKSFHNIGINYKTKWKQLYFFGETAIDKTTSLATINSMRIFPMSGIQLLVSHRYYAKEFQNLYAKSISEGSGVQNENALYMAIESNLIKKINLSMGADFFTFPWLKYGIDKPSTGFEALTQLTYTATKKSTLLIRYNYKVKEKNSLSQTNQRIVTPHTRQKLRTQYSYQPNNPFSFQTTIDLISYTPEDQKIKKGYLLIQKATYTQSNISLNAQLSVFNTDDYDTRLTVYEKGLLESFSFPTFYGKGSRISLHTRYDLSKNITAIIKFANTHYSDRTEIGTGLETINGSSKSDLYFQLRYRF